MSKLAQGVIASMNWQWLGELALVAPVCQMCQLAQADVKLLMYCLFQITLHWDFFLIENLKLKTAISQSNLDRLLRYFVCKI